MKRVIEFEDADIPGENIRSAELLLRAQANVATERAGLVVEHVEEPTDLAGEITRAMTRWNDGVSVMQNALAQVLALGKRLLEESEARAEPTYAQAIAYARAGLSGLLEEIPPAGYAHLADLIMRLTQYERYVWENGYGERRPIRGGQADGGADDRSSGGAVAGGDRSPGGIAGSPDGRGGWPSAGGDSGA